MGGGLAGLTAAIHLSKNDIPVLLFEKEEYPRHKVCGEYVSAEIIPYFEALKLPFSSLDPVRIDRLEFSAQKGKILNAALPLGGYGISRFAFDNFLFREALRNGVEIQKKQISSVKFSAGEQLFHLSASDGEEYSAEIVLGAFGKRSGLDATLNRPFFNRKTSWLAMKSHFRKDDFPDDLVALHNFEGGYCGLSKTETGAVNVCYLANYSSFKKHKDPKEFQENVLRKNKALDSFFETAIPLFERPLSIAQISFSPKNSVEDHILMLGDAAGLLHPLCGNGMAMAIHSAKIASEEIISYFRSGRKREVLEQNYSRNWNRNFRKRIATGRLLQKILLNDQLAATSQKLLSKMPFLLPQLIKQTHGKPIS